MTSDEPSAGANERALAHAIDSNERLRARARAAATLIAAAAGALAAAIVLAPSVAVPPEAQVIGGTGVATLVVSACAFMAASFVYVGRAFLNVVWTLVLNLAMCWRVPPHSRTASPSTQDLRLAADHVEKRITRISNFAIWVAAAGVLALGSCIATTVFQEPLSARVTALNPNAVRTACPGFNNGDLATVERADVASGASVLRVTFPASVCETDASVLVFLSREGAALSWAAARS